jgi:hypothetical protein
MKIDCCCFYCERDHEIRLTYPEHVVMIWDGEIEEHLYANLAPPWNTFDGYLKLMRMMTTRWVEFTVLDAIDP